MNSTETQKHGPVHHTYWLYSDGGGKLGPFTKSEARAIVQESPTIRFRARRDGEVEWKDAAVRLAPKKSSRGLVVMIVLAVLAISLLGVWWSANQNQWKIREGVASVQSIEGQPSEASAPVVEKSSDGKAADEGTRPIASLPR